MSTALSCWSFLARGRSSAQGSNCHSHDLRKSIAKILTIINAKQRGQLRLFYKGRKHMPLDLRPKQTRAIRRRLSTHEKSIKLAKTKKRTMHFPLRNYAVKVGFEQC